MLKSVAKLVSGLLFLLMLHFPLYANHLSLSNALLTSQDSASNTIKIQFDLSWDNSWRDSTNYDAAWIFAKFSTDGGTSWHHVDLKGYGTNPSGFSTGTGTAVAIVVPADEKGCFIQRSGNGTGAVSAANLQLVWDYGASGISDSDVNGLNMRLKIFGIEMVYVPEGSFLAGEANADMPACFKAGKLQNIPISINSENAIVFNNENNGPYYYKSASNAGEFTSGAVFTVPSNFPKGYRAFYAMKYEISQGQWIDFFNTLSSAQKAGRDITSADLGGKASDSVVYRNAVSWLSGDAGLVNGREKDRTCNYLSWMDVCAYADWAGLRPITELEFEKLCRGLASAIDDEYAWGSSVILAASSISGTENGTETITNAGANACYNDTIFTGGDGGHGPLRCGIFATAASTRISAGAGYYGAMELSGNVWERCVTVGSSSGLNFTGTHGDGILSSSGNATNTDWPGIDVTAANGVTAADGAGFRGGSWYDNAVARLAVGDRYWAAKTDANRDSKYGGRCGRTSP